MKGVFEKVLQQCILYCRYGFVVLFGVKDLEIFNDVVVVMLFKGFRGIY